MMEKRRGFHADMPLSSGKGKLFFRSARALYDLGLRAETETERGWLPLLTLSDVSCDEEFIRAFAQRCTECGLSPVHLTDAVLDALP